MKLRILFTLLLLFLVSKGSAQTVDDYIAGGRGSLTISNINAAFALFSAATSVEISNDEANTFVAVTRLLVLPSQSEGSTLLTRLGLPIQGRSIYNWTAAATNDVNGAPIAPSGVSTAEMVTYVRNTFIPALNNSIVNLSRVTDPSFTLHLSENETKVSSVTLDYGDVLMIKSMLQGTKFMALSITAQNCEAQLTAIKALCTGQTTMEEFLIAHPQFLTFAQLSDLNEARTTFDEAVDTYLLASQFIRNRPIEQARLFSYDIDSAEDEQSFRDAIGSLKTSFNSAAVLATDTNYIVNLGAFYSGAKTIREFLPVFKGHSVILGTLKDLTLGQAITGLTDADIENLLARVFRTVPNMTAAGLNGNTFFFKTHTLENQEYIVQVSSNLQTWTDTEAMTVPGGVMIVQDNADQQLRFYRILDLSSFISLQGQVIDPTGIPVTGAQVTTSLDATTVYTDGLGKFSIQTRVPAEPSSEFYTIKIVAFGYRKFEEGRNWGARMRGYKFHLSSSPANDDFADRSPIFSTKLGRNINATKEPGEPSHWYGTGGKSVWWYWKCTSSQSVSITTFGSDFDTVLSVYTGSSLQALSRVGNNDDSVGLTSTVQFFAVAGQTYQIAVDGYGGDSGNIQLRVQQ